MLVIIFSYVHTKISQIKMSKAAKSVDTKIFNEIVCGVN